MCGGPVQTTPGYVGSLMPSTTTYGNIGVQGPRPWTSVPFMQTYGGQGAPWPDLSSQILDSWNKTQGGAGRFGANAASRYGFGGPWQWQPDTRPQGGAMSQPGRVTHQGPGTGQAQPVSQPGGLLSQPGTGYGTQPAAPQQAAPQQAATQPVDHMANFRALHAQNPALSRWYADNVAPQWYGQNMRNIGREFFGGGQYSDQELATQGNPALNQWANMYASGQHNRAILNQEQANRIRAMAGLSPLDYARHDADPNYSNLQW